MLEWSEAGGKSHVATITTFIVGDGVVRVMRYRAATPA